MFYVTFPGFVNGIVMYVGVWMDFKRGKLGNKPLILQLVLTCNHHLG